MIRADITDINKRIKGLKSVLDNNTASSGFIRNIRETARTGRIEDATGMLKASISMSIPFDIYMEVFDNIVQRGTVNDIQKAGNILCEEFVHKVRDAKHMMTVFRQRLSRANSKLKPKEASDANDNTINTLPEPPKPNIVESVKMYENLLEKATLYLNCDRLLENYNRVSKRFNLDKLFCENTRVNGVQDTVIELCRKIDTYNIPSDIRFNTVIETALYGFESNNIEYMKSDILEGAIDYYLFKKDGKEACKTIIENSVFFDKDDYMGNIDILTEEEPTEDEGEDDINISMMEFCRNLYESKNDTYEPPMSLDEIKKNYGIELYNKLKNDEIHSWRANTGIELIHKEPSRAELVRIMKNWDKMPETLKKKSDKKSIELFGMTNKEHYNELINDYLEESTILENSKFFDEIGETPETTFSQKLDLDESIDIVKESKEFKDIFNDYKKEMSKHEAPENKLKSLIHKLYSRDVDSIIEGTPSLLAWIRTFFIIGTATFPVIGPVIMIVGLIADRFIQMGFERKDVMRMVKAFNLEMKKTQAKIDSTVDKESKDRLIKYLKSLEKARDKINEYHDSLITDEDMEKKYDSIEMPYSDKYDSGNSDDDLLKDLGLDFDDLDYEFNINESGNNIFYKLSEATETLIDIVNNNTIDECDMEMLSSKLTDNDITTVAYIAQKFPDIFFSDAFRDGISSTLNDIRLDKIKFESVVDRVYRISALQKAQKILETDIEQPKSTTIYEAYENIRLISETYEAIALVSSTNNAPSSLLEGSISNKLNMASMKLRSVMNKLNDKDREISKSIDIGLNNFKKGVERSLTNDNRESIIKGSILPSASKLIKLGIINAGLIAIHQPVIAIIGTLGYIGCSAKFKAKERQMLIDEIEIELKMCQKYIDIAEQKNDMKALKQLLMMQRDLQRQQQRIKYKMKVEFGQKYYDPKNVNTD